jgi:hypothetical protein
MNIKPNCFLIATAAALLGAASLPGATLPVADDFTGATPGNTLPGWTTTTGGAVWATADTNQFPAFVDRGDGNIAIEWSKGTGTRRHAFDIPAMTQGVLKADFNCIQDGDDNGTVKDALYIRVANVANLAAGTFAGAFIDRSIQGLELNTWHTATVIFNGDVEPLAYATTGLNDSGGLGGLGTVASGFADVFLDGKLISDEAVGIVGTFTYAGMILFASSTTPQIVRYDNFSVTEVVKDTTPKWAGYPVDPSGWVDTTPWLGWINVSQGDYVWSIAFSKYIYLPEGWVGASGSWSYIPAN